MIDYSYACQTCKKQCEKRITQSRLDNSPPKYCSNKCRFGGAIKPDKIKNHICGFCGITFKRYTPDCLMKNKKIKVLYCNTTCAGKAIRQRRGNKLQEKHAYECELCGKHFERYHSVKRKEFHFCSKKCASKILVKNAV